MPKLAKKPNSVDVQIMPARAAIMRRMGPATRSLSSFLGSQIETQDELDKLTAYIAAGEKVVEEWDGLMNPVREATYKAWKEAVKVQDGEKKPLVDLIAKAKRVRANAVLAAEQSRIARQAELDARQNAINAELAKKEAELAISAGADPETVEVVKQEALTRPAPVAEAPLEAAGFRQPVWLYSCEVEDLAVLFQTLAQNKFLFDIAAKSANVHAALASAFRPLATASKDGFSVPGLKLVKRPQGT